MFVDDFCWLLRAEEADHMATSILATLVALGVPLSWKKTHLAEVNTWLVFVIHPNTPQVQMIATKHTLVLDVLELLIQNTAMTAKSIERALGRLQCGLPLDKKPHATILGLEDGGYFLRQTTKKVRLLALLMKEFTTPYRQLAQVPMVGMQRC